MKRDLKLNMEHLSGTVDSIENYLACIGSLKDACTAFLEVLKKQDSVSYTTLSEEWEKDIIGNIGEMEERLTQMKTTLSGYIEDMESYVAPESPGTMMRVDRNDIWYNISQIGSGISKVFDICCDSGSSFPDYKHPFINWFSKDAAAIRLAEEQERGRRERNYDKLAGFRSGSVSSAFRIFSDEVDEIWSIYNNAIVPFENTDDDYSQDARFWYDMWATTGNKLGDLGEGIKNLGRGLWDAAVDLLDGVFSLAVFLVVDGCIPRNEHVVLPDWAEERVTGMEDGIVAIFTDPVAVVEAMGQSMMDTYEEEGIAYAAGYLVPDIAIEVVGTKGLGSVKGATKVADTASDAASVAKKVDTVTDVAGAAKKVDTVTDAASAAKKVDTVTDAAKTADKVTDAAKTADKVSDATGAAKKVDTVTDTASAAKKADTVVNNMPPNHVDDVLDEIEKFYDDIYEQQRYVDVEYEEFLDDLQNVDIDVPKVESSLKSGLTQELIDQIVSMPKGSRPDPLMYLTQEYIDAHLAQFDDGASIIMTKEQYVQYVKGNSYIGIPDDGTQFVMPKNYCDEIANIANGDISIYESKLGFDIGHFDDGGGLVRIDIDDLSGLELRMPSGNEYGANSHWIPGGKTDGGIPEAVTDLIPNISDNITITEIN